MYKKFMQILIALTVVTVVASLSSADPCPPLTLLIKSAIPQHVKACRRIEIDFETVGGVPPITFRFSQSNPPYIPDDGHCVLLSLFSILDSQSGKMIVSFPLESYSDYPPNMDFGNSCGKGYIEATDSCQTGAQVASVEVPQFIVDRPDNEKSCVSQPSLYTSMNKLCGIVGCSGRYKPWADKVNPSNKVTNGIRQGGPAASKLKAIRRNAIQLTNKMKNASPAEQKLIEGKADKLLHQLQQLGY